MTDTNTQANGQTQALTPYQQRAIELREEISQDSTPRAIVPRTFAEAQAFAAAIAHSNLVPDALKENAPNILMTVLAGSELGIPPIRSLTAFHVMEGIPKPSSETLGAIVTSSPICEYLEPRELSASRVVFATKRRGRPEVTIAFTDEDVKAANLDRPTRSGAASNHVKFPIDMKAARARSKLCKLVYPDLCAGITTKEEYDDLRHQIELEGPPPTAAAFSAPAPLPTPPAAPANKASNKSASKGKPIDTTATETASTGSSNSPASTSSSTSSAAPSSSSQKPAPTATPATQEAPNRPPLGGPDPGAEAAFAKAREAKGAIDSAARRAAEEVRNASGPATDRDPPIVTPSSDNSSAAGELGPNTTDETPTQTQEDNVPPATADDDFGSPDPAPTTGFVRSLEEFEKAVRAAVVAKDVNRLRVIKEDWGPWSKDQSDAGGFKFAHKMRDVFAKAKTDLGIK